MRQALHPSLGMAQRGADMRKGQSKQDSSPFGPSACYLCTTAREERNGGLYLGYLDFMCATIPGSEPFPDCLSNVPLPNDPLMDQD